MARTNHIRGFSRTVIVLLAMCFAGIAQTQPDPWQTLVDSSTKELKQKQYAAAKKSLDQALKQAERSSYADERIAKTYKLFGDLYFAQQKYDEAKANYSRDEDLEDETGRLRAADLAYSLGEFAASRDSAQAALKGMESKFGHEDVLLTTCLVAVAKADKGLNNYPDADEMLTRALHLLDTAGMENRDLANALEVLGQLRDEQGKASDAEVLLKRALSIRERTLDPDAPELAASYSQLAAHYTRVGDAAVAEPLSKKASEIQARGLLNLKDFNDKDNGFRIGIPRGWTSALGMMPIPGMLMAYQSPDKIQAVLVMRTVLPSGRDPVAVFNRAAQAMGNAVKGQDLGDENVELSGLPARRIVLALTSGAVKARDWVSILVTSNQVWIIQVIGPDAEMNSPSAPAYAGFQKIQSSFAFLDTVEQILKTQIVPPPTVFTTVTTDNANQRHYSNQGLGIRILLPSGWHEGTVDTSSIEDGETVVLTQTDTLAFVVLTREKLEALPELYLKTVKGNLATDTENFHQISEERVTRAGHEGTRITWVSREKEVDYRNQADIFSDGMEHYRIAARAPSEVFGKYEATFKQMLDSVEFFSVLSQPLQ